MVRRVLLVTLAISGLSVSPIASADSCWIDGNWYQEGQTNPTNCRICDPTVNRYGWTEREDVCNIHGLCYDHGYQHPSGCATCDISRTTTDWTVSPDHCLIADICYSAGEEHSTGCGYCDPDLSQYGWTVSEGLCLIGDNCFYDGHRHLTGKYICDAQRSQTEWTAISWCPVIIMSALNEAYDGDLGSTEVADCLCAKQAAEAGLPGTWRSFLSSSARDVRDIVDTELAERAVISLVGWPLYETWWAMFEPGNGYPWGTYIYTFDLRPVDEIWGDWVDADAWHGSNLDGTVKSGYTCNDWASNSPLDSATNGELDWALWLGPEVQGCDQTLAVVCIRVEPPPCCIGNTGNVDGSPDEEPSISDISVLIDLLFISGKADLLMCPAEADVNQSGGPYPTRDDITISDVATLIDYLFITGQSLGLPGCP